MAVGVGHHKWSLVAVVAAAVLGGDDWQQRRLARALVSGVGKLHRAARRHGAHLPDRTAPELDFDWAALNDAPSESVIEPPFKVEATRST